jgi:hypothetical protein
VEVLTPGSAGDLPPLGELIVDVPFWRHPCASGPFFSKRDGLWRVTENDPDSGLYAASPDADTVIAYMTTHTGAARP